jgi:hypothetical protein
MVFWTRIHRFSVRINCHSSELIDKNPLPIFHGKHKDKRATSTHLSNTLSNLALLLHDIANADTSLKYS